MHAKSTSAQEVRALLTARKLNQAKLLDVESGMRGVLRGFGLKVGSISRGRFEARILELIDGHAILETVIGSMLAARTALEAEFKRLHRELLALVRADPVCRQLMSVPGVGAITAITFKSGVDDPSRFKRSRDVGPHFGLTPRKYQSGEVDVTGSITKVGDRMVRTALYEAASVMLPRTVRFSGLKAWAMAVARRRGTKKARVALARKLGVILHHVDRWYDLPLVQRGGRYRIKRRASKLGQTRSALPRSRRWDGEDGEAAMSAVAYRLRWKDGLTASSDRMMWQHMLTTDRSK